MNAPINKPFLAFVDMALASAKPGWLKDMARDDGRGTLIRPTQFQRACEEECPTEAVKATVLKE